MEDIIVMLNLVIVLALTYSVVFSILYELILDLKRYIKFERDWIEKIILINDILNEDKKKNTD